ncbi:hypothetical protein C8_408 [Cannes 8 virus]|nr:hypothetical protein C8_408 [Cannes 8 virus]
MSCVPGMCDSSRMSNGNFMCSSPVTPPGFALLGQLPYSGYYSKFLLHAYRPSAEAANMQSYDCATRVHQPYAQFPPQIPLTQVQELYQPRASRGWVGCRQ